MFFTKWFEGIKRDKEQLYYITGQILKFKTELLEFEDSLRKNELFELQQDYKELTERVKALEKLCEECEKYIQNNLKH